MKFKTPIEVQAGNSYLDGKVYINARASIPNRPEEFQVTGTQIITDTGTSNPSLYIGYNSSGANTVQLGRGRTADGLSYIDFNGEVMAAGDFGFRIVRGAGVNATTDLIQVGTGSLIINAQNGADTIFTNTDVGIGTTSPSAKLEISSTGNTAVRISTDGDAGDTPMLQLYRSSGAYGQVHYEADGGNNAGLHLTDFRNDANSHIIFNTQGDNERMRIEADGNVGIGTTAPASKLQVEDSSPTLILNHNGSASASQCEISARKLGATIGAINWNTGYAGDNSTWSYYNANNSAHNFLKLAQTDGFIVSLSGSEKMRVNQAGNVGIGKTNPSEKLHVSSGGGANGDCVLLIEADTDNTVEASNPVLRLKQDGGAVTGALSLTANNDMTLYNEHTGKLFLGVGGSTKMTIDTSGRVGIGTTSPVYKLQLSSNSAAKPSSSLWTVVSDSRVKENIRDYTTGLEAILKIEPKLYDYNGKAGFEKTKDNIGIIAQDIQNVMPETIKTYNTKLNEDDTEDTELLNFDGHAVTFALINAVKDLKSEIEELKKQINK